MTLDRALFFFSLLCCAAAPLNCPNAEGAEPDEVPANTKTGDPVLEYKTRRLLVRTDLPADDAEKLLKRLEETLGFASEYWGRKTRRRIECYVVHDLKNWSEAALPHRLARVIVGGVSGGTVGDSVGAGKNSRSRAIVYASSRQGVAEHEIVHAYCHQNFGSTGPAWYREGMAEMAVLRCSRQSGVQCSAEQFESLQELPLAEVGGIVRGGDFGRRINSSLETMLADPKNRERQIPLSDWSAQDAENVKTARQEYLRSWALCYMLQHNPNYAARFKALGVGYMAKQQDSFDALFKPLERELAFEYAFFLRRMANGYRVDLCSWDWTKQFRKLEADGRIRVRVKAAWGYQPTGLRVSAGRVYAYRAAGSWGADDADSTTNANGAADGKGRLMAVVMDDYQLGKPMELGAEGEFVAPTSGNLYLRCQDSWSQLADNHGAIWAEFSFAAATKSRR